jgi:hypothetical protein
LRALLLKSLRQVDAGVASRYLTSKSLQREFLSC